MNSNIITVGPIGIPSVEERHLESAFNYFKGRQISYQAIDLESFPMILIVNADDPHSLITWRAYRNKLKQQDISDPPSIAVSKVREFKTEHYQVRRPLIASRIISVLDRVVDAELDIGQQEAILVESSGLDIDITSDNKPECVALVVDDSLPVRMQLSQILEPFVSRVDLAATGEEVFDLLDDNEYDVIFLDIVLPGIDGYEVCKTIKQGKAKNTPIIMLTGSSSSSDRIKGKLAGCNTYLIKPVNQLIFQEVVNEYINSPSV